MTSRQIYSEMSYSSSYEVEAVPRRGSSYNAPTGYLKSQAWSSYQESICSSSTGSLMGLRELVKSLESDTCSCCDVGFNTKLDFKPDHALKAQAPWAKPEDFIPRASGFTPNVPPKVSPQPRLNRFERLGLFGVDEKSFYNPSVKARTPSPIADRSSLYDYSSSQLQLSFERITLYSNLSLATADWDISSVDSMSPPEPEVAKDISTSITPKAFQKGMVRVFKGLKKQIQKLLQRIA